MGIHLLCSNSRRKNSNLKLLITAWSPNGISLQIWESPRTTQTALNSACLMMTLLATAIQLLGSCSVSIKDALSELGKAKWYPLQGVKSGKISVSFEFTEDQESDEESSFEMVEEEKEVEEAKEEVVEEKVTQI